MRLDLVEKTDTAGERVLELVGSLDLTTRQAFIDTGMGMLDGGSRLLLDMTQVTFIDSTGIGALVELMRVADTREARVEISGRSARVERVLEATGLDVAWSARDGGAH